MNKQKEITISQGMKDVFLDNYIHIYRNSPESRTNSLSYKYEALLLINFNNFSSSKIKKQKTLIYSTIKYNSINFLFLINYMDGLSSLYYQNLTMRENHTIFVLEKSFQEFSSWSVENHLNWRVNKSESLVRLFKHMNSMESYENKHSHEKKFTIIELFFLGCTQGPMYLDIEEIAELIYSLYYCDYFMTLFILEKYAHTKYNESDEIKVWMKNLFFLLNNYMKFGVLLKSSPIPYFQFLLTKKNWDILLEILNKKIKGINGGPQSQRDTLSSTKIKLAHTDFAFRDALHKSLTPTESKEQSIFSYNNMHINLGYTRF